MPPVHTQHKEGILHQTEGCPYAPIHLDAPICLDPCMFGAPYVWMPLMFGWIPVSLDAPHMSPCMFGHPHIFGCPLCLDAPCMLGHPHMFGCPPYLWMMFGCPLYIHNTNKACFVRLGVSICPIHLDAPCT